MKTMSKTMKKCSKLLAVLLSVLTIMSVLPMQTFAVEMENYNSLGEVEEKSKDELIIEEEIIDKRTENSKTYLMEDGTYCDIVFSNPIHEYDNGSWEDVCSVNSNSIDEISAEISSQTATTENAPIKVNDGLTVSSPKVKLDITEIKLNPNIDEDLPNCIVSEGDALLSTDSFGIVSFNIANNTIYEKAEAVIDVSLIMDYYSESTELMENMITIQPLYSEWSKETLVYESIENECYDNPIVDFNNVTKEGEAIWNITSEYIKIETGVSKTNQMLITQTMSDDIYVSNAYLLKQYRVVDDNDYGFTYHTIDMGRAGTAYINDYTNTLYLERSELGIPGNILPVSISTFITGHVDYYSYGAGGRINYDSNLTYSSKTFTWNMFNGSSIRFQQSSNKENDSNGLQKWVECAYNKQGFELWVDPESSDNFIYSNNFVVDEEGNKYIFNGDGYLTSVISNNKNDKIIINYENRRIDSIVDGVGRYYVFDYATFEGKRGISKITAKTKTSEKNEITGEYEDVYTPIKIMTANDGSEMTISYNYKNINGNLYLTEAIYPDGKKVEYQYDGLGRLISIKNIDNSILEINYAFAEEIAKENKNPIYYGKVASYSKKVLDENNNYILEFNVSIDSNNSFKREFIQKNSLNEIVMDEEIQFNRKLDVTSFKDPFGNAFYADYSNHEIISLVIPDNAENLVSNGEMKPEGARSCVPEVWGRKNISNRPIHNQSEMLLHDGSKNDYYVQIQNEANITRTFYQEISVDGHLNDKYVVSAWGRGFSTIPREERFWGVKISAKDSSGAYKEIHTMSFDTSLWDVGQTQATAFSLEFDTSSIKIELISQNQFGAVAFDDVSLYKADDAYVAKVDDVKDVSACTCEHCEYPNCPCTCASEEECTCVSCDIRTESTYDTHGNTLQKTTTNGLKSLISKNEYTADSNYLSRYTDENDVTTSYEYSLTNGLLMSEKLANDASVYYCYDAIGALTSVSQTVTNVLDPELVTTMNTTYSYSNDKISSVKHNGFSYEYAYDPFGNVTSISVEKTPLVNYQYNNDYFQNLSLISYGNGTKVLFEYEKKENKDGKVYNTDNIAKISYDEGKTWRYEYTYDDYGNLKTITDNVNNTVTSYDKTIGDVKYAEVIETLGENSTIIYGITEEKAGVYTKSLFGNEYLINPIIQYDTDGTKVTTQKIGAMVFNENGFIENSNTKDAFDRLTEDAMKVYTESGNINSISNAALTLKNEYTYKDASQPTQTTMLVDTFTSSIVLTGEEAGSPVERTIKSYSYKYDYDSVGRITMIYQKDLENGIYDFTPVIAYKYDEAGQLIVEVNTFEGSLYSYTYDVGGNLTSKNIHGNATYDENEKTFELGPATETIPFTYDSVWKDKLVSYNGKQINYDGIGNPLNYIGTNMANEEINMNFEWEGKLLKAATSTDGASRFEYIYNDSGLRTGKAMYSKEKYTKKEIDEATGNTVETQVEQLFQNGKIEYIWSGNTLVGYKVISYSEVTDANGNYVFDSNGKVTSQISGTMTVMPLYNEQNEVLGVNCYSVKGEESATETFLFTKDAQGNITSICNYEGEYVLDFYYDAFGNFRLNMTGAEIERLQEMVNNATGTFGKVIVAIGAALAVTAILTVTFTCAQTTYRGYIYDLETGLYYCQSRFYSPTWGRFINADDTEILELTQGTTHGANLFTYCNNDPINNIDPNGYYYISIKDLSKIFICVVGINPVGSVLASIGLYKLKSYIVAKMALLGLRLGKFWGPVVCGIITGLFAASGLLVGGQIAQALWDCVWQGKRGIEFTFKRNRWGYPYAPNIYAR